MRWFVAAYALAHAGGVLSYLPLLTFLLPVKVEAVAGAARIDVLTVAVIAGAIAASAANIVFGTLSDRSRAAGGGRRRWMAGGIVATALSYALIARAGDAASIVVAVVLFQVAVNALLAPMLAIMADEIDDARRGVAGGLLALGAPVASGVSALVIGAAALGEGARLAVVMLAVAACVTPLLLLRGSVAAPAVPATPMAASMRRGDLAVAWAARLAMQVAAGGVSAYLLYYFQSVSAVAAPLAVAARTGNLLTIAFLVSLPVAVLAGRWSDSHARRKPVLLVSAGVAAAGLVCMGLARAWDLAALGFAGFAMGSAVFLALHSAFAMQLLPDPAHRGRDLGLLNLANTLPALLGPVLAWWLATPDDFAAVMLVLAVLAAAGGAAMLAVRGGR